MSILFEKSDDESRVFFKKKLKKKSLVRYRARFEPKKLSKSQCSSLGSVGSGTLVDRPIR